MGKRSSGFVLGAIVVCSVLAIAAQPADPLRERARRLHRQILVMDCHADMAVWAEKDTMPAQITDPGMAGPGYDASSDPAQTPLVENWTKTFPPGAWRLDQRHIDGYWDIPRARAGGMKAQFFAVYMDREPRPGMAVKRTLDQIEAVHAVCEKYPRDLALVTTAAGVRDAVSSGRIAVLIGVEGGYMIEDDIRVLRLFHRLGVRYLTLTHSFNTHWADSSGTGRPVTPQHDGLSPFGRAVVAEMNRLGMMVDTWISSTSRSSRT